jgi:peptide deformylase
VSKILPIVQLGDPVLRGVTRPLDKAELAKKPMRELIEAMRETMRKAPGVGLAAPQIGLPLRLAVIEDREETVESLDEDVRAERERDVVPFHVIVNPEIEVLDPTPVRFFEGCLSLTGFVAMVPRAHAVRVRCLDEKGEPRTIEASGWYARILQHETDHLNGTVYVDRMDPRTFMSADQYGRYWGDLSVEEIAAVLGASRPD